MADGLRGHQRLRAPPGGRRAALIKLWLHISKKEQRQRLASLARTPTSLAGKAGELNNQENYRAYLEAVEDMLQQTSPAWAPWTVVESEDKYFGRLKAYETIARAMELALAERSAWPRSRRTTGSTWTRAGTTASC